MAPGELHLFEGRIETLIFLSVLTSLIFWWPCHVCVTITVMLSMQMELIDLLYWEWTGTLLYSQPHCFTWSIQWNNWITGITELRSQINSIRHPPDSRNWQRFNLKGDCVYPSAHRGLSVSSNSSGSLIVLLNNILHFISISVYFYLSPNFFVRLPKKESKFCGMECTT